MRFPRLKLSEPKTYRWINNLSLVLLNSLALHLLLPLMAIDIAYWVIKQGWGILNFIHLPYGLSVILSVVILDMAIYLQHVLFHYIPLFWRLHKVHHADLDYDVTTGLRFHTIEIILSMGIKMLVVLLVGIPPIAVIIFEILLNAAAMFNHGNILLRETVDRRLLLILVTPDMHRVHHSVIIAETNSNYGFNLPWWDRLFGTYIERPRAGHQNMTIGLAKYQQSHRQNLWWMLSLPLRK